MDAVRVDKWLWAARFFKTRALATDAVLGGHVQVNGARVKPAKDVRVGDAMQIRIGTLEWIVDVRGLADRRGPATVARALYEERADSKEAARAAGVQRRLAKPIGADLGDAADEAGPAPTRRATARAAALALVGRAAARRSPSAQTSPSTAAIGHHAKRDAAAGGCHVRVSSDASVVVPLIDGQHSPGRVERRSRSDQRFVFVGMPSRSMHRAVEAAVSSACTNGWPLPS